MKFHYSIYRRCWAITKRPLKWPILTLLRPSPRDPERSLKNYLAYSLTSTHRHKKFCSLSVIFWFLKYKRTCRQTDRRTDTTTLLYRSCSVCVCVYVCTLIFQEPNKLRTNGKKTFYAGEYWSGYRLGSFSKILQGRVGRAEEGSK